MRRCAGSTRRGLAVAVLLVVACAPVDVGAENYHFGLDFIEATTSADPRFVIFPSEFHPFPITDPSTNFVGDGGLAGWTEEEVRREILLRVEDAYRAIDTGDPNTTVRLAIHLGPVPQGISGARYNVALAKASTVNWGEQVPGVSVDEYTAAVYLNKIDEVSTIYPDVSFDTPDAVLNAISGTAAHEIGHFFGAYHVGAGTEEPYPLMAIGLTPEARFTVRRFSEETVGVILPVIGTVNRADFNMDDQVDGQDINVMLANFGRTDALFQQADTNGDHTVDGRAINTLISNFTLIDPPAEGSVVARYNPATGEFGVTADGVKSWTLLANGQFTGPAVAGLADVLGGVSGTRLISANVDTVGEGDFFGTISRTDVRLGQLTEPGTPPDAFTLQYSTRFGGEPLQGAILVVPEPGTLAMLLGGLAGVLLWRWRRRWPGFLT